MSSPDIIVVGAGGAHDLPVALQVPRIDVVVLAGGELGTLRAASWSVLAGGEVPGVRTRILSDGQGIPVGDLEIAALMKPATEVGGDYYDFDLADDGCAR